MTDLPEGLSPHARAMAEWFVATGRLRFSGADMWRAVAAVSPASAGTGERRHILDVALRELAAAGVVRASATTDGMRPALPTQVRLLLRAASPPRARADPWHPAMARISAPRPPGTTLGKINAWVFRHRSAAVWVPLRERALEITGDEKAFDRLAAAPASPDELDDVLMTYRDPVPLHRETVGDGTTLLVVENATTTGSLRRELRKRPGAVGEIACGGGNTFRSSVLSLRDRPPGAIRYFGDLDAAGLRIPAAASALARQAGLPPVRPATGLYTLLLHEGVCGRGRDVTAEQARALVAWLDPEHRPRAGQVLTTGARLAQEAVGRQLLAAGDGWRSGLTGP